MKKLISLMIAFTFLSISTNVNSKEIKLRIGSGHPTGLLGYTKTAHEWFAPELKKRIENSRDLVEREIIISSPANKNIVYKLETAFDIIVTHEKRHYEQSRVVLQLMKKEVIN